MPESRCDHVFVQLQEIRSKLTTADIVNFGIFDGLCEERILGAATDENIAVGKQGRSVEDSSTLGQRHQIAFDIGVDEIAGTRIWHRIVETDCGTLVENFGEFD